MKTILLISTFLIFINSINYAQCNNSEHKLLVLGDSWAFFSWTNNSYNENMDRFGLSDKTTYSTSTLSVNGSKASNFFTDPARVQELRDALANNPSIEYIHFSLGGNDILGTYHVSNTVAQNQQDYITLIKDIKSGIDTVHAINPMLKILISGYDYPNFEETILNFAIPSQHPFYNKWTNMGQPTAAQLNTELTNVTALFLDSSLVWNNVAFVNNLGLMQNTYGQASPLTVAPGGTYAAGSLVVPGGMPNYPSPTAALNVGGLDSFHLNNNGFETFIKRHFQKYYWEAIRNADVTILANDTTLNGTLTANSVTSDSLSVGQDGGVLTFNTSGLNPTTNIEKASIFINRKKLNGANLIAEDLTLEIKSGYYGANLQLELDDYNSISDTSSTVCTFGTVIENNSWMRIDLPHNFLPFINKAGFTQFKLKYTTATGNNTINFYNNSDSTKQAILDITYGVFSEVTNKEQTLSEIFPNPFNNEIRINSKDLIDEVRIVTINGQLIASYDNLNKFNLVINTREFNRGIYIISIKNKNGKNTISKLVK